MEPRADYTDRQRHAFGVALRNARGDRSAIELADQLGYKAAGTFNHWERATSAPPSPPVVFALEELLEVVPGHLSQHLGYLPVGDALAECTVETALADDADLTRESAEILLRLYRDYVRMDQRR